MEQNNSRCAGITLVTMTCLALACIIPLPAGAQIDCSTLPQWSAPQQGQQVRVNQQHVFCGELNLNSAKLVGFHSRPNGINPLNAGIIFNTTITPNAEGLYEGRWLFEGLLTSFFNGKVKFKKRSTMFPDVCDRDQVLNSIVFASQHQAPCPQGSGQNGAVCGPGGVANGQNYCLRTDNNDVFTIELFFRDNDVNFINSAYPLMIP